MLNNYILDYKYYLKEAKDVTELPLYLSDGLKDVLKKIKNDKVSSSILGGDSSETAYDPHFGGLKSDVSYLDIDKKDSKNVTYLPVDRLSKIEDHQEYNSRLRQSMGWGKMINKLFPGIFTNVDIDNFYDRYRPEVDSSEVNVAERFKLVTGEDIRSCYHEDMYDGTMTSCMRHDECQPYFDIYCDNPDKVSLLVYYSARDKNKLIGRALVWKNLMKPSGDTMDNRNPYTLLDRVYYVEHQYNIENLFHKYAIDHGWIYKKDESFLMNGVKKTSSVAVRLKAKDYLYYPFMDTMRYWTPDTGRAASTPGNAGKDPNNPGKVFKRYSLQDQNGDKEEI